MKLLQAVFLSTLVATAVTARAAQGDWLIEGAPQAIIWDGRFKLGVGGQLGVLRGLTERTDVSLTVQYASFAPVSSELNETVTSYGGLVTYFFSPTLEGYLPKVGVHAGYTYYSSPTFPDPVTKETSPLHYFELGGDGQLVFDVGEKLKFFTMMSPAYLIGKDMQFVFRIGLGLQYQVAP